MKKTDDDIELYNIIWEYKYLGKMYQAPIEEMEYIAGLIISGCDANDIFKIYRFWKDTNEKVTIIEDIYKMKVSDRNKFWVEESFNILTNFKSGVLTREELTIILSKVLKRRIFKSQIC